MAKKTTIGRLRELAIKRINMQFLKPKPKIKKLHFLDGRRKKLLRKIAESTDIKNVQLSRKEKILFHDEIKQKGGLIKWAKSQSQYRKILNKANPSRYKDSINKGVPPKKDSTRSLPKTIKRDIDLFMKESKIDKIWKNFCKEELIAPNTALRLGSKRIQAKGYINVKTFPVLPTKQLSTEIIFEAWGAGNKEIARNLINQDSSLSFQELLIKIIMLMDMDDSIPHPYLWWIYPNQNKKMRLIYQDADGDNFVKIDNKWQMAYSLKAVGALAGRQGGSNVEDLNLPTNSYFVVWENEDNAKNHSN